MPFCQGQPTAVRMAAMSMERIAAGTSVPYFGVVIENEKFGVRFIGKSFAQLLYNPGAGRMACDVEVQNATPIMTDDKEAIQYPERDGRHGEEVHRSDGFTVIA
jgi:hypothetical protein